jgi:hypothetical protein
MNNTTSDNDRLPPSDVANEITPLTRIGKFKIPTELLRAYTMVFALIAIWIYFHYSTGNIFLEPRNFSNLMRQTSVTGVLAVGMLMVIITGQIDLSVGSVVGLAGGIAAIAQGWLGWGLVPSLSAGIAVGIAIGLMQGSLTAYLNIPAFIVTLGGLLAWRGVILGLSRGETIPLRIQAFKSIGQDYVGPTVGWIIAALAVAGIVWMTIARNRARRRHGLGSTLLAITVARLVIPHREVDARAVQDRVARQPCGAEVRMPPRERAAGDDVQAELRAHRLPQPRLQAERRHLLQGDDIGVIAHAYGHAGVRAGDPARHARGGRHDPRARSGP